MSDYKPVNWTDSMVLTSEHFRQTENFFISSIADAARLGLTGYNYGLLPNSRRSHTNDGIRVNEHVTGHIEVQLSSCEAITAHGYRIRFDAEENGAPLIKSYSPAGDKTVKNRDIRRWDIILSVDPFERTPCGEMDPEEVPPRHPDCQSRYSLYVMPEGEINSHDFGRHYITIGRLRKDGERFLVDEQYIPPCCTMNSHPALADYYENFATLFNGIEKSSKAIISKIHDRSNNSELSGNIQMMSAEILRYIADMYFDFRNKGRYAPPVDIVGAVSSLAHRCYASLTMMSGRHKEELLKYFYEWTDISPGSFEEMFAATMDIIYEHQNIRSMMVRSEQFLHTFAELWERLARLEFIGQHKESIIISERHNESRAVESRSSWITD
ncbi:MAG: type VI secretion system baseplate subunit TssK [Rikenellaceae bacterium]|nr:type VI secretion system baseplate subunit TssK [Rikenellaceae bacterium]